MAGWLTAAPGHILWLARGTLPGLLCIVRLSAHRDNLVFFLRCGAREVQRTHLFRPLLFTQILLLPFVPLLFLGAEHEITAALLPDGPCLFLPRVPSGLSSPQAPKPLLPWCLLHEESQTPSGLGKVLESPRLGQQEEESVPLKLNIAPGL